MKDLILAKDHLLEHQLTLSSQGQSGSKDL